MGVPWNPLFQKTMLALIKVQNGSHFKDDSNKLNCYKNILFIYHSLNNMDCLCTKYSQIEWYLQNTICIVYYT